MKPKYAPIIIGSLLLCLFACKKDSSNINPSDIVGKWYENKLSIQQHTISTGAVKDTTYLSNAFTTADYFQFNKDSTAVISSSGGVFSIGSSTYVNVGNPQGGQLYFRSYSVKGTALILQVGFIPTCYNCSQPGPVTETILQLDANNLVLQAAPDTGKTYKTTTVTYYTKGQ